MTFNEFVLTAEARFGIEIFLYKSKAGHEMVDLKLDGQHLSHDNITGPDAGYSCHFGDDYCLTIFGWAYCLDRNTGEWYLIRDGISGWRQGTNPFPEIPEERN